MDSQTPLIATIVGSLVLAFILGAIANRLRMPPLIGYLVAGIVVGPFTPGFVANADLAQELAEIGVILLMFGVGLHFSLKDLLRVKSIAIPGALLQILCATFLGMGLAWAIGWPLGQGIIFGLALSVASTVVMLTALQELRLVETKRGQIAIGWLVVEDIVMVLALVLIPALSELLGGQSTEVDLREIYLILFVTCAKVVAFVAVMLVLGKRAIPWILKHIAGTGSRELFGLSVLSIALGFALGASYLFGVSFALGAFFAGMMLAESDLSHRAAEESLPLRDMFCALFFVSVGMLFDPAILLSEPLLVLATVLIIVFGKSIVSFLLVLAFRHPISTALTISASLAQIGEFSFILATLGLSLNLLSPTGSNLILAGAIFSIILNPFLFTALNYLRPWLEKHGEHIDHAATSGQPRGHTVLVGYGELGRLVGDELTAKHSPFIVIENHPDIVEFAQDTHVPIVFGYANELNVLTEAELASAHSIVLTFTDNLLAEELIINARTLNPNIAIIVRATSDEQADLLKSYGATHVVVGKRAIAKNLVGLIK